MRVHLVKNMMIEEYKDWRTELEKSSRPSDKIRAEELDKNFDWELAHTFIVKYVTRCLLVSIEHHMKFKATLIAKQYRKLIMKKSF